MAAPKDQGSTREATRPRRSGRPTLAEAAQLDEEVRRCSLELFLERGYQGTSMDAIAEAAGTTKASLYGRFPSKEMLFTSVLEWAIQRPDWPAPEVDPPDLQDLEGALTSIAETSLQRALDPMMVQLSRIATSQGSRLPDIRLKTQVVAVWPRRRLVVELLERHAADGSIVADEPELLAEHFLGMVAGVPARLASFGIVRDVADQERHTRSAVQLFLRSLRPG